MGLFPPPSSCRGWKVSSAHQDALESPYVVPRLADLVIWLRPLGLTKRGIRHVRVVFDIAERVDVITRRGNKGLEIIHVLALGADIVPQLGEFPVQPRHGHGLTLGSGLVRCRRPRR